MCVHARTSFSPLSLHPYYILSIPSGIVKMAPVLNAAATLALAGSASAFVAPSAFKGAAVTSKASASSSTELSMAVDTGINGFGRIGRLVARSMVKNPETDLKLINTGAAPEYMAYQVRAGFVFEFRCRSWGGDEQMYACVCVCALILSISACEALAARPAFFCSGLGAEPQGKKHGRSSAWNQAKNSELGFCVSRACRIRACVLRYEHEERTRWNRAAKSSLAPDGRERLNL